MYCVSTHVKGNLPLAQNIATPKFSFYNKVYEVRYYTQKLWNTLLWTGRYSPPVDREAEDFGCVTNI